MLTAGMVEEGESNLACQLGSADAVAAAPAAVGAVVVDAPVGVVAVGVVAVGVVAAVAGRVAIVPRRMHLLLLPDSWPLEQSHGVVYSQ